MRTESTKKIVRLAMLSALSVVLMLFVRFPLLPGAAHMEYSPADIPVMIATFLYGPIYGLVVNLVVCIIQGFTVSAASGWIGMVMNFVTTAAFCLPAGLIYYRNKTLKSAVIGLIIGSLSAVAVAVPCNLLFVPMFMKVEAQIVAGMLLPIIIPFNAIKTVINSVVVFLIYKPISRFFQKTN